MIDLEDLGDEDFFVACYEDILEKKYIIYSWKGSSIQFDNEELVDYIHNIKCKFFNEMDYDKVVIIEEIPYSESDEFMSIL